jgi:hypothetical protein
MSTIALARSRSSLAFALSLVALAALSPSASHAAWQPGGTPLSPIPSFPQSYNLRGAAPDGANGVYTVWDLAVPIPDFSGTNYSAAAERTDVNGDRPAPWTASGTTFRTWADNVSFGTFSLEPLEMFSDGAGGAILPAIDHQLGAEQTSQFRLYQVTPGGSVHAMPPVGDLPGFLVNGAAADGDGAGGVFMVGHRQTFGLPPDPAPPSPLFAQHIDATSTLLWDESINAPGIELVPPGQAQIGAGLSAISDGAGGAYFAWIDLRQANDPDVYVQHIDAIGSIASGWPAGGLQLCGATGAQSNVHLAHGAAGGVIAVWNDQRDGTTRLYANAVDAAGILIVGIPIDGRQLPSDGVGDAFVNLADDAAGGCFVVNETVLPSSVAISRLYRLDGLMQTRAGWPANGVSLNTQSPGVGAVGLVADGLGGAYVSFRNGFGTAPPQGLYAQHYGADGAVAPGWTSAPFLLSNFGQESRLVRSGAGAIAVWNDSRGGVRAVYGQRLAPDGPVPVTISLVSTSVDNGVVHLRWFVSGASGVHATVGRRTEGTGWVVLGDVTSDGSGYLDYADASVTPGQGYFYLVSWTDGTEIAGSEAWVDVPTKLSLTLAPRPNPVVGVLLVGVTLPDARGGRLELIDINGRRVASRDLSDLGAGHHNIRLDETARIAPGVYTLRMIADGAEKRTRVTVVR